MKLNYLPVVVLLVLFSITEVYSNNTKDFMFSSNILFNPIAELAKSKNTEILKGLRTPIKTPAFEIHMTIEDFKLRETEKAEYDNALQMSFKEIENTKILIFKKNNFIKQIHILDNSKKGKSITQYKRNLDSLFSKIPKENNAYFEKTKGILLLMLERDDFLANLPLGEHILTCSFRLLEDKVFGDIYFDKTKYNYRFSSYKGRYRHASLAFGNPTRILLMIDYNVDFIPIGNLFEDKDLNGFECYFYKNQGLKFLTELKNGKQMDVTVWSKNGTDEKKIPFEEWVKIMYKKNK